MNTDKEIFKGKKLSDLFEEIYDNSKQTRTQISSLIVELKGLIENIQDATLLVPMIKDYLEAKIKNDDALIRLATIIQRMESAAAKGESVDSFDFSDLENLIAEQEKAEQEVKKLPSPKKDEEDK